MHKKAGHALLLLGWLAMLGAAHHLLFGYQARPGSFAAVAGPDTDWRAAIGPGNGIHGDLVLFAHPRCPCTRATFAELDRTLAGLVARPRLHVWFSVPEGEGEPWAEGELWRRAEGMGASTVGIDPAGRLAARYGATTSGELHLIDATGRELFAGGITSARGHEGRNDHSVALARALAGRCDDSGRPVYGCQLASAGGTQ